MTEKTSIEEAEFLYRSLMTLRTHLLKRLKQRRPEVTCCDLTMPQSNAMLIIRQHGGVTMRQLSDALGVAAPSASTMVERLVEMGMLRRETCPSDRRAVRVQLTETGERHLAGTERVVLGVFTDLLTRLGPETAAQWVAVHGQIRTWIEDEERETGNIAEAGADG